MIVVTIYLLLYMAREYIENAIILDGDQMIYNPDILRPDF